MKIVEPLEGGRRERSENGQCKGQKAKGEGTVMWCEEKSNSKDPSGCVWQESKRSAKWVGSGRNRDGGIRQVRVDNGSGVRVEDRGGRKR